MIQRVANLLLVKSGGLKQDLINKIVMIDETIAVMTAVMIDEMIVVTIAEMIDETIGEMIVVMIAEMIVVMIAEMIAEDSLHNKTNSHHHRHQNDGQTEVQKQQTVGEPLRRSVQIRKLRKKVSDPSNFIHVFFHRPRTGNDRPSQQHRSDDQSSDGLWRSKNRPTGGDQPDEPRDSGRSGPQSSGNVNRSDENNSWRTREKTRLNRFVF